MLTDCRTGPWFCLPVLKTGKTDNGNELQQECCGQVADVVVAIFQIVSNTTGRYKAETGDIYNAKLND